MPGRALKQQQETEGGWREKERKMVYEREREGAGGRAELASSLSGREIRVSHTKRRERNEETLQQHPARMSIRPKITD